MAHSGHALVHCKCRLLIHCQLSSSDLSLNRTRSRNLHRRLLVPVSEGMAPIRMNRTRSSRRAWA